MSPKLPFDGLSGEPEWETSDGRRIPVSKLETSHLRNIIAYLQERIQELDKNDSDWAIERIVEAEEWLDILEEEASERQERGFTW